jgi:hypothetical protein
MLLMNELRLQSESVRRQETRAIVSNKNLSESEGPADCRQQTSPSRDVTRSIHSDALQRTPVRMRGIEPADLITHLAIVKMFLYEPRHEDV